MTLVSMPLPVGHDIKGVGAGIDIEVTGAVGEFKAGDGTQGTVDEDVDSRSIR